MIGLFLTHHSASAEIAGFTPTPTPETVNDPTATPIPPTATPIPPTPTNTPVPPTATPRPPSNSGQSSQPPTATPTEQPPIPPQDIPELGRGPTYSFISISLGFILIISFLSMALMFAVYKAVTKR